MHVYSMCVSVRTNARTCMSSLVRTVRSVELGSLGVISKEVVRKGRSAPVCEL